MSVRDPQIHMDERDHIHEDIEKIRQVLQTVEGDLHFEQDAILPPVPLTEISSTFGRNTPGSSRRNEHFMQGASHGHTEEEDDEGDLFNVMEGDDFPATAAMALALNRAYQEVIEENLKRVRLVLTHNRERQLQLEEEITESSTIVKEGRKKKCGFSVYGVPYFKDVTGLCPPPNEDTILKQVNNEVDPHYKTNRPWLPAETKTLRDAVMEDCRQKLIVPLLSKREIMCEKMLKLATDEERPDLVEERTHLEEQINWIKKMSITDLLRAVGEIKGDCLVDDIDWMKIATVDFNALRTQDELKMNWIHFVHPDINTTKFKPDEDSKLARIAEQHGYRNWNQIAVDLGTHRTAFQCLQRYQMKLEPSLKTGKWSTEEDDILREVVDQCRLPNGDIDWSNVSYFMEGRSYDHCQQRWNHINTTLVKRKGKWTEEEDMKLLMAVKMFGTQWYKVTKFVPGRTNLQVRERWHTAFQNCKKGSWTYEEDKAIWIHVQTHGPCKWAKLARSLKGRGDNAVLLRYKRLEQWSSIQGDLSSKMDESITRFAKMNAKKLRLEIGMGDREKLKKQKQQVKEFDDETVMLTEAVRKGVVAKGPRKRNEDELLEHHKEKCGLNHSVREESVCTMEEDVRNGLFIPRPPPEVENTRIGHKMMNQRFVLQQKLHSQIEKSLVRKTKAKGMKVNRSALEQQVTNILGGHNTSDLSAIDRIRLDAVGKMLTVKEILDLSTSIQNKVSKSKKIIKGKRRAKRDSNEDEDDQTGAKIWKLVSVSNIVDSKPSPDIPPDYTPAEELDHRVSKLLTAALNVDLQQSVQNTHSLCAGELPASWKSMQVFEENPAAINCSIHKLSQVTGAQFPPIPPGPEESSVTSPREHATGSKARTKTHTASRAGVYSIPPLPPNRTALQAFRRLLLQRKELVDIAGKYHISGSLTMGRLQAIATSGEMRKSAEKEARDMYTVMRAEQTQNQKLQTPQAQSSRFEGYVGRNSQLDLDSVMLLPTSGVTCHSTTVPPVIPQHQNVTPDVSTETLHASLSDESLAEIEASSRELESTVADPLVETGQLSLEDVIEPISGFVQEQERVTRILPEHIDPTVHRKEFGRYSAQELLLAKSIVREKETTAIKTGKMAPERFEHHMLAVQGSSGLPEVRQIAEESKTKTSPKMRAIETIRGHHDYTLLQARFKSLFLWPALLSTVNVRKALPLVKPDLLRKSPPVTPLSAEPTLLPRLSTSRRQHLLLPEPYVCRATFPATTTGSDSVGQSEDTLQTSVEEDKRRKRRKVQTVEPKERSLRSRVGKATRNSEESQAKRRRKDAKSRLSLSVDAKAELVRILKEMRDEHIVPPKQDDAEILEEAELFVALLQQRMCTLERQNMRKETSEEPVSLEPKEYIPCIFLGGKLFPMSNPLFRDFIVMAKAMSQAQIETRGEDGGGEGDRFTSESIEDGQNTPFGNTTGSSICQRVADDNTQFVLAKGLKQGVQISEDSGEPRLSMVNNITHQPVIRIQPDSVRDSENQ